MGKSLDRARAEVRRQWGRSSPFRLGLIAFRYSLRNPYPAGTRGHRNFDAGRAFSDEYRPKAVDSAGNRLCGCIPGHNSNVVTHRCETCGLEDKAVENGEDPGPCLARGGE